MVDKDCFLIMVDDCIKCKIICKSGVSWWGMGIGFNYWMFNLWIMW